MNDTRGISNTMGNMYRYLPAGTCPALTVSYDERRGHELPVFDEETSYPIPHKKLYLHIGAIPTSELLAHIKESGLTLKGAVISEDALQHHTITVQIIAGSTGEHLSLNVKEDGSYVHPLFQCTINIGKKKKNNDDDTDNAIVLGFHRTGGTCDMMEEVYAHFETELKKCNLVK